MKLSILKENLENHKTVGWHISVTPHAKERAQQRFPNKSEEEWQKFHRNVVHGVINSTEKKSGVHLLYSKSHGHAVVAHVDRKKKEIRYITVPPAGKDRTTDENDTKMIVENIE